MAVDIQKRNQRQNAWQKQNTDRINFVMPKGYKKAISDAADICGITSSEFIRRAIVSSLREYNVEVDRQDVTPLNAHTDMVK